MNMNSSSAQDSINLGSNKSLQRTDTAAIDGPAILTDFKSFHAACVDLSEAINAWLRKYEADGLNLK
jgi:hypothetical protein